MRTIKFRAWDKSNCSMISDPFEWVNVKESIMLEAGLFSGDAHSRYMVMQYTGLKDKNGVEIYEGDILKDDCDELLEVKFGELPLDKSGDCVCTYQAWYCKCYGKLGQAPFYECQNIGDWMEVIGNIYQNPELLTP